MSRKRCIKWIVNILCYGILPQSYAQSIEHGRFIDQKFPVFDAGAIARQDIERISITLFDKPSLKPMVDQGDRAIYEFDSLGRMLRFSHVFSRLNGSMDTLAQLFTYQGNELVSETEVLGSYRRRVRYEWQDDHTVRQTIEVKRGTGEWQLLDTEKKESQTSQNGQERMVTELVGGVNSIPYQRTVTTFDTAGKPIIREVWNGSRIQYSEKWFYKGASLEAYELQRAADPYPLHITYKLKDGQYDSGTWCTEGHCRDWSMVYFPDGRPKGWIFIEPDTQDMDIWEFQYTFRQP